MDDLAAYNLFVEGSAVSKGIKSTNTPKSVKLTKDEKIKKFRLAHKIKSNSKTCLVPNPVKTFAELISRYQLSKDFFNCFTSLEYEVPTPVQMQCIPVMLERHNVFTIAPTGSGKTAAFLIPLIHDIMSNKSDTSDADSNVCNPIAIILSPTIELAKQTFQEYLCLVKEIKKEDQPKFTLCFKGKNIDKKADVIISTPLRIMKELTKKTDASLCLKKLRWLVIDESDKMLEDSINSFADQFKVIYSKCQEWPDVRVAMFSATQNVQVVNWCKENLADDLVNVRVGVKGAAVETVSQELRYCYSEETKFTELQGMLTSGKLQVPCLIFLDQSNNASYLHEFIKDYGSKANITVDVVSGKLSDTVRRDVISRFREGKIHFLICTNLLARGIDFKGVATIVNYDLPKHKEEYIHRIGRCGRAGQSGKAISFWTDEDALNGLPAIMSIMKASNQPVNDELFELVRHNNKKRNYKGDKIMTKLKRKYKCDDGKVKHMTTNDKRRKMFVDSIVVRKKFLHKKKKSSMTDTD